MWYMSTVIQKEMGEEDKEDEGEERTVLNKRHEGRRRRKEGMEERKDTPVCGCVYFREARTRKKGRSSWKTPDKRKRGRKGNART